MRASLMALSLICTLAAPARGQTAPVTLEPLVRIGCVECSGPQMFAAIQTIAVSTDRVYVADTRPPFLRVFDSRGRVVKAFGAQGDGPGELRLPIAVVPQPGGRIDVYDMRQRRFTRFDSTGAALSTWTAAGFPVVVAGVPGSSALLALTTDFRTTDQPLLRIQPDGTMKTLTTLTATFPKLEPGEHARTPSVAVSAGAIAVGDGVAEYRIRRFTPDGTVIGDIVRDVPKRRKTPADIEQERAQFQRRAARMQAMVRAEGRSGPAPAFTPRAEHHHFLSSALEFDEQGRLWVRTERGGLRATVFDIFDAAGRYTGEVSVAAHVGPFAVRDGILAGRVRDEDEVEYVAVWRVR